MSPFKEFVTFAKRYNGIKDEQDSKEPDLDKEKYKRNQKNKGKHHKKPRGKMLREQFQNRAASKQSMIVQFAMEPKETAKGGSKHLDILAI